MRKVQEEAVVTFAMFKLVSTFKLLAASTMHAVAADALLYDPGGPVGTHVPVVPQHNSNTQERDATSRTPRSIQVHLDMRQPVTLALGIKRRTWCARVHRRRGLYRRKPARTTCQGKTTLLQPQQP